MARGAPIQNCLDTLYDVATIYTMRLTFLTEGLDSAGPHHGGVGHGSVHPRYADSCSDGLDLLQGLSAVLGEGRGWGVDCCAGETNNILGHWRLRIWRRESKCYISGWIISSCPQYSHVYTSERYPCLYTLGQEEQPTNKNEEQALSLGVVHLDGPWGANYHTLLCGGVESGVFEVKDNTQVVYLKMAIYTDYNRPNKVGPPSVYCSLFFSFLFFPFSRRAVQQTAHNLKFSARFFF